MAIVRAWVFEELIRQLRRKHSLRIIWVWQPKDAVENLER